MRKVFLFLSQTSSLSMVCNSYLTRLVSLYHFFFYFDVGVEMTWIVQKHTFCQNHVKIECSSVLCSCEFLLKSRDKRKSSGICIYASV